MIKINEKRPAAQLLHKLKRGRMLLLILLPVVAYYVLFRYIPLLYTTIAFTKYNPFSGVWGSEWIGFSNFTRFFSSPNSWQIIRNTVVISLLDIAIVFSSSIIFALLLNEIKGRAAKSAIQTLSYLPHFISIVIIAGMFISFLSPPGGFIYKFYNFAASPENDVGLLDRKSLFWGIYTLINLWKGMGWGSIVFVAALSRVDKTLYEAAAIDGANRWKQTFAVTLPSISITIITMLIVKLGQVLNVGYELIILISNSQNYEFSEVLSTYVYNHSIGAKNIFVTDYSYAAAVGLLQSVLGFILVIIANKISAKISEVSLW